MWEHILLLRYALRLLCSGTQKIKLGDTCFVVALARWPLVEVVLKTLRITVFEVEMAVSEARERKENSRSNLIVQGPGQAATEQVESKPRGLLGRKITKQAKP